MVRFPWLSLARVQSDSGLASSDAPASLLSEQAAAFSPCECSVKIHGSACGGLSLKHEESGNSQAISSSWERLIHNPWEAPVHFFTVMTDNKNIYTHINPDTYSCCSFFFLCCLCCCLPLYFLTAWCCMLMLLTSTEKYFGSGVALDTFRPSCVVVELFHQLRFKRLVQEKWEVKKQNERKTGPNTFLSLLLD